MVVNLLSTSPLLKKLYRKFHVPKVFGVFNIVLQINDKNYNLLIIN